MTPRLFVLFFMIISASFRIYAQDIYTPEMGNSVRPRMKTLAKEQRDGYECRYIEFSTEQEERIKTYLLVPDKASWAEKCPAVVMLHEIGRAHV